MQVSHERRNRAAALAPPAESDATAEVPHDANMASDSHVALLTALPFGLAAAWMLLLARHSQATGAPWGSGLGRSHATAASCACASLAKASSLGAEKGVRQQRVARQCDAALRGCTHALSCTQAARPGMLARWPSSLCCLAG